MDDQKLSLTIFLLKSSQVAEVEKAFKNGSIPLAPPLEGFFTPIPSAPSIPRWLGAVQSIIQSTTTPITLLGQSPAGILIVRRGTKTYAVTFGHAWQQLEDEWLEIDFGRRIALNSIPRNQVVEIKAEQVFAKWHVADERAPRASSVDEFGVEFDRDLVGVFGGMPEKSLIPILGKSIRGGTSFKVNVPFDTLAVVLDKAGTQFDSTTYKKVWPEIDTIMPVTDSTLIGQLEKQLDADLLAGKAQNKIVLFIPTRRDEGTSFTESYVFGRMSKYSFHTPYLTIDSWLSYAQKHNLTVSLQEAKGTRLHLLDESKEEFQDYSVFQCMGYEMSLSGQPYILSAGIWYEVVASFLKKVK